MPAAVFGNQATAVQVYQAFFGGSPSNPLYTGYLTTLNTQSAYDFAVSFGNSFAGTSDAALATTILTNLGITTTSVNAASYTALNSALQQFFAAYPAQRGAVVLNLTRILPNLESDVTFGVAALAYNSGVTSAFTYASNTANTQVQTGGTVTSTASLTVNSGDVINGTTGNDVINGSLFFNTGSGTFVQTLQSGDSISGGAGSDTLNLGLSSGGTITPAAMTSVETINATVTTATTLDNNNGTGLATLTLSNSTAQLDMTNLSSLLANISLVSTTRGVVISSAAAAIAGTADTLALSLSQVTGAAATVSVTGYEVINLTSTGTVTNTVTTLTDADLKTLSITGSANVTLTGGTGVSTNTLTLINASAATGAVTIGSSGTSLGVADQSVTGGSGNDTFFFGSNYSSSDTVNGGTGTDTISVSTTLAGGVASTQANLSLLETLSIVNATNATTYSPNLFGGATSLALAAASTNAVTVNYLTGTSGFITTSGQALSGARTLNVAGSATTDVLNFTIGSTDSAGTNHTATTTLNGVEQLNIASNGTSNNILGNVTMTPTAALEAITVTGNAQLFINGAVTADTINASANTGGLVMSTGTTAGGGITIIGTGTVDTLFGSANVDIIDGGAGNDRIQGGATDAANQADVLTGGAGSDTFVFRGSTEANMYKFSAGTTAVTKITDFVAGSDKISIFGPTGTSINFTTTQTIGSAASLTAVYAAITAIAASTATTYSAAVVVVSAGAAAGTYFYLNDQTAGVSNTNDMLINITGISGTLSSSDIVFI